MRFVLPPNLKSLVGLVTLSFGCFLSGLQAAETPMTPAQLDFFEKKVRPVLSENCYKCHSQNGDKIKGGLLLDSRTGWQKGGDTGPAIVPGDPEKSLLIKAIRYRDKDLQMPPSDRQLPANIIQDLENWVKMGAPDPRTNAPSANEYAIDFQKARKHWSFQPVKSPEVPQPEDSKNWVQTPIDNFILSTLSSKSLSPSSRADKITLIRRATFDLIGLPPTPREVDDFLADSSPDAFSKLIERLLASPHYGERWGRYWLDLAHYADTRGNLGGDRDDRYPYSYVYRDYVIRAFNEDLPYDQFLLQQLAADLLPQSEDKRSLAAMGFLTLGNRLNNQANDIIDDRIEIVGKGTMGLTVTCARCHDHKFDPIPTRDYYALHGVFNSCVEPREKPLIAIPTNAAAYQTFQTEFKSRQGAVDAFRAEATREYKGEAIGKSANYMLAVVDFRRLTNGQARTVFMDKRGLNAQIGNSWDNALRNWENRHNPVFAPWFAFAKLTEANFATQSRDLAARYFANADKSKPINPLIARLFANAPVSMAQVAARYSSVFNDVETRWHDAQAQWEARSRSTSNSIPALKGLEEPAQEEVRRMMYGGGSPMFVDDGRVNNFVNRDNKMRNRLRDLENAIAELVATHPGSPMRAPVLEDANQAHDSNVLVKGNAGNRGPVVPRHFLSILTGENPAPFKQGSGRLELARAIASRDNPLTARVFVNRVWLHHFGEGLVRTPDDFGTRGETPSHPELLDYLASRFVEEGWSLKKLHRLILLSSVYQQASDENPRFEQIDPDNRWLWKMNRRRLDFEALRDTILYIGGDLDLSMGGRPVRLESEPYSLRRTVYGLVDRKNLPNMFQAFDFSSPDLTTSKRETTVVPQQALFMMNSQLVIEQARNIMRRIDVKAQAGTDARVNLLYQLIYQRPPTEVELKLARNYLKSDSGSEWITTAKAAWAYGYGEYDAVAKRPRYFIPCNRFNGSWVVEPKVPDARLKGVTLNATGGSPGQPFAVIRRWTAPRDGFILVEGTLGHNSGEGDGVRGIIFSSRAGELASAFAFKSQAPLKLSRVAVQRGENIDFITDCRANSKGDNFTWSPKIRMENTPALASDAVVEWSAQTDFTGEPQIRHLNSWEKFAQVLLETNELSFVN